MVATHFSYILIVKTDPFPKSLCVYNLMTVLGKLKTEKRIKLSNHEDQMSLNSNSMHQLCSQLNQTHQQNELTHKLICYQLPINQTINQPLNQ